MSERRNLREELIVAGINEINTHGANGFSVRRVAEECHVSSAAPYKHFKDKKEFIAAIIDFVNDQWALVQNDILSKCGENCREQMVEVAVGYVKFLMEHPHYRQTLMLKNADFDNLYHRKHGEINSCTEQIMMKVKETYHLADDVWRRKTLMIRSILFGSVFLFDGGEFMYTQDTLEDIRYVINREFEVH